MLKVYFLDTGRVTSQWLQSTCHILPSERMKKVNSCVREEDRLRSAAVGYLLDFALGEYGVDPRDIKFTYGKFGKPYLVNNPVRFNLSHSGSIAACALSDGEVGVDVQEIRAVDQALVKRVCTQEECNLLAAADNNERAALFARIWSVKESYIKFTGEGLSVPLRTLQSQFCDGIKLTRDGRQCGVHFQELKLNGYALTVCSALPEGLAKPREVRPDANS